MNTNTVMEVEGLSELKALMNQAPEVVTPIAAEALDNMLRALYADVEPYPAETIANSPQNPKGRWYERHYGPRWVIKGPTNLITTRKRANIFEGAGLIGGRNTSEQLQLRWRLNNAIQAEDGYSLEGSLENNASYALDVQGPLDVQAENMKTIGWKSVDDGLADIAEVIDQILGDMLTQIVERLAE